MMSNSDKKLYIKTYGCQMNFYDSGKMEDVLTPMGFSVSDQIADSDLVILNTCHIREKAAEKVYSELGRVRKEKEKRQEQGKNMLIAVAGCVAQAEGKEIKARAPFVDIVVGPQAYHRLPELVANADKINNKEISLDFSANEKFDSLPQKKEAGSSSAFLTIQEGCDKFCTFCVVPYTRGAEFSRSVPEIYREAVALADNGAREIYLLGQNVNAYHGKAIDGEVWGLGKLIRHISKIKGVERIRYTTSHPRDVDDELILAHKEVEELMPFLHLPVQSGSNEILKQMNRKHTSDDYKRIIDKFREARPDIQFSSDFIVGFPGETDEDFQDTMRLIKDVGYAQAYSFMYSPRPGTPAAIMEDAVPEKVKAERLAELQDLLNNQQEEFNKSSVGDIMPVLFERKGKYKDQLVGRSPYMQAVHVIDSGDYLENIFYVKIEKAFANSLSGKIVNQLEEVDVAINS